MKTVLATEDTEDTEKGKKKEKGTLPTLCG